MNPNFQYPRALRRYDFHFPELDTQVRVEEGDGEVVIRATRDTFSLRRKEFFLRELTEEGFIPEEYRWSPLRVRAVRWIVDPSWTDMPDRTASRAARLMIRLVGSAAIFWVALIAWMVWRS